MSVKYTTYVTDKLRDFLTEEHYRLGFVEPGNPDSGYLSERLELLHKKSLSNHSMLTRLMWIYINFNKLLVTVYDGKFFIPDYRMHLYFNDLFKNHTDSLEFKFSTIHMILCNNRILEPTQDHMDFANREDTGLKIIEEEKLIKSASIFYK